MAREPQDPYNPAQPALRLDDLRPRPPASAPVLLSIMMVAADFRASQMARSLECLARSTWRDFEVLICDHGSTTPLEPIVAQFEPYLRLKFQRHERTERIDCPTAGFHWLMPEASGPVWAIMQPEIMLAPTAAKVLYRGAVGPQIVKADRYVISKPHVAHGIPWVSLRVGFLDETLQKTLDGYDWHASPRVLERSMHFWQHTAGLSHRSNAYWLLVHQQPYWFVGACAREAAIWSDMPTTKQHATIDLYLLNYRHVHEYLDIVPLPFLGFHQDHHRERPAFDGAEQDSVNVEALTVRTLQ